MMAYVIGVANKAQVGIARQGGFVAFSHGREAAVRRLAAGDRVIYYAPRSDFDGDPVQAFVALAEVTGDAAHERPFGDHGLGWVRDARFEPVTEAPVRPLLDRLSFVRDKSRWGMAFRQGKFAIGAADYRLIAEAMEAAP